ncbi:hypothetical protein BC941DRAFT_428255 [Chlamydoabsidia padenii]|nr:hypothetical protein BC941DRAFT_428255 [Chlamydoabsidia padenii]
MKLTYLGIAIGLFMTTTTTVFAEMDHFLAPGPNTSYKTGDTISFLVEDMPDEEDRNVNANLYKADGSLVKTIKTWSGQSVDDGGDDFPFDWLVDVSETGSYYVEISAVNSREDMTQSYPFQIQGAESGDDTTPAPVDTNDQVAPQSIPNEQAQEESSNEPEEAPKKQLSLHNQQSKVAHISSHNDIDTVSEPPVKQAVPQQFAQEASTDDQTEPLRPVTSASASLKDLTAADDLAVEQEKKWIAQQKGSTPPSKESSDNHHQHHHHQHHHHHKTPKQPKVKSIKQEEVPKKKTHSKESHKNNDDKKDKNKKGKTTHNKSSSSSSVNKESSKQVSKPVSEPSSDDIKSQIKAQAKETVTKAKEDTDKSTQEELNRQKLSLAEQEALDDKAIQREMAVIKSSQMSKVRSSSKEKREAYRKVMRNRAKFAKQGLQ